MVDDLYQPQCATREDIVMYGETTNANEQVSLEVNTTTACAPNYTNETIVSANYYSDVNKRFWLDIKEIVRSLVKHRSSEVFNLPRYCDELGAYVGVSINGTAVSPIGFVRGMTRERLRWMDEENADNPTDHGDCFFLTRTKTIKIYSGYPCSVVFSAGFTFGSAVDFGYYYDGSHGGTQTIPFSCAYALSLIELPLLAAGEDPSQRWDGDAQEIVALVTGATVVQAVREECVPANPLWLRWINDMGGYEYRMFRLGNEKDTGEGDYITEILPYEEWEYDQIESKYTNRLVRRNWQRETTAWYECESAEEIEILRSLTSSEVVQRWFPDVQRWREVRLDKASVSASADATRAEVEITIETTEKDYEDRAFKVEEPVLFEFVDHLYTTDGAILTDFQVNYQQDFTIVARAVVDVNVAYDVVGVRDNNSAQIDLYRYAFQWYFHTSSIYSGGGSVGTNRFKFESVVSGSDRTSTLSRLIGGDIWQQVSTNTITNPTTTPPINYFCAIGRNNNGSVNPVNFAFEMYQITIAEGGVTIHDLRPAVRRADNVAGLLDIITGTFYPPTAGTITAVN